MSMFTLIFLTDSEKFVLKKVKKHGIIVQSLVFPDKNSSIFFFHQILICHFIINRGIFLYFRTVIGIIFKH